MPPKEKKKVVKVSARTLELAISGLEPYEIKINSLLEGHYRDEWVLPELDLMMIMEVKLSISVLLVLLRENLSSAATSLDTGEEFVMMKSDEISLMSVMSRSILSAVSEKTSSGFVFDEQ